MSCSKTLTIPARTENLAEIGQFVQRYCQRHSQVILLDLAVTEFIGNAIQHGNASSCTVTICAQPEAYVIEVQDNGQAFNPLETTPLPMGELREGNYGLAIVRQLADLDYAYRDHKNCTTLRFRI